MPFDPSYAAQTLRQLAACKRGRAVIIGAGQRTAETLQSDPKAARAAIDAIFDDNATRVGQSIEGIPVTSPDVNTKDARHVVICSEMFERELTQRARQLFGSDIDVITTFNRSTSLASILASTQQAVHDHWHSTNDREALWLAADRLQQALVAQLIETDEWRYGPKRQVREFSELVSALGGEAALRNKSILNAGCGRYHPLGQSILTLIAGASRCSAIDLEAPLDESRTARATADLLAHLLLDPSALTLSRTELLARLEPHLDLAMLQQGTFSGAIRPTGILLHHVADISDPAAAPGPFDIIISRDVFEHLMDVPAALAGLHRRLAPKGVLIAWIDCSDHRRYANADAFAHWSLLTESADPAGRPIPGGVNGLRWPQYGPLFTQAGLEIVSAEPIETEPIPAHVRERLAPMYREMADADLAVVRARVVLQRKGSAQHVSSANRQRATLRT